MTRKRSPNLSTRRVEDVVGIIRAMPGRPEWNRVIAAVADQLKAEYTRQTLFGHDAIRLAFQDRKKGQPARPGAARRRRTRDEAIGALERDNERLSGIERALKAKFVRWAYNANAAGITEATLEKPLPTIDRT